MRFAQTREAYAQHIAGVRPALEQIRNHAKKPNRRTILVVAGTDKLDILKIFREKVCESRMHITLVTEQSLAKVAKRGVESAWETRDCHFLA